VPSAGLSCRPRIFPRSRQTFNRQAKFAFFVRSMRRLASIAISVAFMALALHVSTSYGQNQAPDFTLTDLNGVRFSLSDYRGRIVLLDFFATWCRPCIDEIPHLITLTKTYPNSTLVIISISLDFPNVDNSVVRTFAKDMGITWTVARDTAGVANKYEVFDIPTLIFVDQEGNIRSRYIGLTESDALRSKIQLIIPEFVMPTAMMTLALAATLIVIRKRQ